MVAEIPFGVVAAEVVVGQRGRAVTCGIEAKTLIDDTCTRNRLRHQTEGSINELLHAP